MYRRVACGSQIVCGWKEREKLRVAFAASGESNDHFASCFYINISIWKNKCRQKLQVHEGIPYKLRQEQIKKKVKYWMALAVS